MAALLTSPSLIYPDFHWERSALASYEEPQELADAVLVDDVELAEENYDIACFCVTWLREVAGIPILGNAEDITPNVDRPYVGGVILLDYDGVAHAGLITAIFPSGAIYMKSANKTKCQVTESVVSKDSSNIRGFWFKNING